LLERLKNTTNSSKATSANIKGEYTMQQIDTIQLAPKASTIFDRIVHFFVGSRISTPQPDLLTTNVDWPDSDSKESYYGCDNQHVCGGYNEAFIVQHWASYDIR
jgi:hypothetical protein